MDRDTYYYLSDPCSPRIHPSPPQYGQGYLLLLVRSVFSPHSSLSPSIWTGIFIITCQIRVLPAFIPLPLNMDRDIFPLNMDRDTYYYLSDPCSPRIHPSPPQYGQGYLLLLVRSVFSPHSSLSPSIWTGILIITCQNRVLPAFIPLALNMDRDTLPLNIDRDTYYYLSDPCSPRIHPSPPQYGQGYLLLLVRSVFSPHSSLSPSILTGILSPSIWTGILIITCQIRVLPAFIPLALNMDRDTLPLNMDRDTYYYLSDPCSPRIHPSPPQYGQGYSPPQYEQGYSPSQYGQGYLLLLVRYVFSPHSSLSPSIWTGILIITCQIRVLPAFIPLPLNMDRDTYYYLSDPCSPRIHPSLPQYGQGYLLLLVRSVFSPHSSLSPSIWTGIFSPSIWTGILIITCQIRVLPAFIPLPLNMDRDTYYYLSDPCSPRIHPSPPQYGQGYLLLLVRTVFSPHSSLSPSIWTGILIITCQNRVLPAFIPLPLNMDRDTLPLNIDRDTYYYLSDPCSPRIHPSPPQYGQGYLLLLVRSVFSPHSSLSPSIWTGILIITCQIRVLPAFIPLALNMDRDTLPLNMDRDTYYYLSDPCSPRIHPSPPQYGQGYSPPQYGQGYLLLLVISVFSPHSSLSPSIWTRIFIITCQIRVLPAFIPLPLNMDRDIYYYLSEPCGEHLSLSPSIWTGILIITCQIRVLPHSSLSPSIWTGILIITCQIRVLPAFIPLPLNMDRDTYYYLSDPCGEHSSLSPSIWTGILIITCQIRVLPAFIPLPLNMDRDTYYYLSDPCGDHSSLSPSIWTGILIITCQIRVLPAFIPLPLNMDRNTYYYLSDPCSPRIHPSPPQYGQGYLLLLVRSVFSPHSSLSPSIWTGILIITCQIRVLPAFIPLPLNLDRDTYYYLSDTCSPRIH